MPGWSGEEIFGYMKKVRMPWLRSASGKKKVFTNNHKKKQAENFHGKEWFQEDSKAHGYSGPLDIEPHDLVCKSIPYRQLSSSK